VDTSSPPSMSALASALAAFAHKMPALEGSAVADDEDGETSTTQGMCHSLRFPVSTLSPLQISPRHLQSRLRPALQFLLVHLSLNLFFGTSQSCARRAETST
jgi:hypothetical protein